MSEINNIYDHSKAFKEECLPYIVKIKQFCMARGIPFYMTYATANDKKRTEYITSKQMPPECDTELTDDRLRRIILSELGFELAMNYQDSFDMDVCDDFLKPIENRVDDDDD